MFAVCERNGWGDPFSYARSKEMMMAIVMKQQIASSFSGPDGFDEEGAAEYKSTTQKNIQGTYNGISVQPTWEDQLRYLCDNKIGNYRHHYFARFDGSKLLELWVLDADDVLQVLIPKLHRSYHSKADRKDPRLGAVVSKREIYKYGRCLIG